MKIDISSKQTVVGLESDSATKLQMNNAKILFGRNAAKVVKALDMYSKERLVQTEGIDTLLAALKTKNLVDLEKFAKSAPGKKMASNVLKLANAKTLAAVFKALKAVKAPAALNKLIGAQSGPTKIARKTTARKSPTRRAPAARKAKKLANVEVVGIPMSRSYAMGMPVNVMDMLQTMITPALAKRITKTAEEGVGVSMRGLGFAKIKKLIDALPANLLEQDALPDFVQGNEDGAVTAAGVGDSGEFLGYYSPKNKKAMFRVVVQRDDFDQSGIVSLES